VDVGTGTHTIEQQIVASEMEVPLTQVRVSHGSNEPNVPNRHRGIRLLSHVATPGLVGYSRADG
jgi:CO/xanthine dehydrogenase Mo-binding subunit